MITPKRSGGLPRNIATIFLVALLWMFPTVTFAQEIGPARGALVVIGGGETRSHGFICSRPFSDTKFLL